MVPEVGGGQARVRWKQPRLALERWRVHAQGAVTVVQVQVFVVRVLAGTRGGTCSGRRSCGLSCRVSVTSETKEADLVIPRKISKRIYAQTMVVLC